eukprot:1505495-Amphidinium_carterae.1
MTTLQVMVTDTCTLEDEIDKNFRALDRALSLWYKKNQARPLAATLSQVDCLEAKCLGGSPH